jgi:rubrerythrin
MKYLTKTRPDSDAPEALLAQLPHGHDDPTSEFHVPAELRELYAAHLPAAQQTIAKAGLRAIRRTAGSIANDELGEPPVPPESHRRPFENRHDYLEALKEYDEARASRTERRDAMIDELVATDYLRLQSLAFHRHALGAAAAQHARDAERAAKRAAERETNTCPVCGVLASGAENGSPVKTRSLTPHVPHPLAVKERLHSCAFCYDEALAQLREARARAASLVDHRHPTRAAAVKVRLGL